MNASQRWQMGLRRLPSVLIIPPSQTQIKWTNEFCGSSGRCTLIKDLRVVYSELSALEHLLQVWIIRDEPITDVCVLFCSGQLRLKTSYSKLYNSVGTILFV